LYIETWASAPSGLAAIGHALMGNGSLAMAERDQFSDVPCLRPESAQGPGGQTGSRRGGLAVHLHRRAAERGAL
jgi:hypothetical protein